MLLGVDFDNTIVCYDQAFHAAAVRKGLVPPETPVVKNAVRDYLRQCNREDDWTELQGFVYGAGMEAAQPFPGALEFFARCRERQVPACIISHKTRQPFLGQLSPQPGLRLWRWCCRQRQRAADVGYEL